MDSRLGYRGYIYTLIIYYTAQTIALRQRSWAVWPNRLGCTGWTERTVQNLGFRSVNYETVCKISLYTAGWNIWVKDLAELIKSTQKTYTVTTIFILIYIYTHIYTYIYTYIHTYIYIYTYLAILCDLFGMVKWPFQGLSDLQLGDQKVTLNHLVRTLLLTPWFCSLSV